MIGFRVCPYKHTSKVDKGGGGGVNSKDSNDRPKKYEKQSFSKKKILESKCTNLSRNTVFSLKRAGCEVRQRIR